MLQMLVITMREGIEAFLIIAIMAAYLKKTGRTALLPAVGWGTFVAILLSIAASFLFAEAENKPLWEGLLASVAAVMVASMTIYMWRTGRFMRQQINTRLEAESSKVGFAAAAGIFLFTLLMITREGMETALIISSLALSTDSHDMLVGAVLGLSIAALLAFAWSRYGHRVNLGRFLQVTAIFLMVFVVQLIIYAFHEFTEGGVFPGIDNVYWHMVTEPYGPEGIYGHMLSYALVLIPATWLAYVMLQDKLSNMRLLAPSKAVNGTKSSV